MADTQSSGSIRSRIAALNLEEVHAPSPGARPSYSYEQAVARKKAPPPPPPSQRLEAGERQRTINNPPIQSHVPSSARPTVHNQPIAAKPDAPKLPPRLPPRTASQSPKQAPSLPPRKSSDGSSIKRKDSAESISTIASFGSTRTSMSGNGTIYQVRAPAYDPSKLPPLPPKKVPEEEKHSATRKAMRSISSVVPNRTLPPQLPSRPPLPARQESRSDTNNHDPPTLSKRSATQPLPPRRSAIEFGMNKSADAPPPIPTSRPSKIPTPESGAPPPIPLTSRPNLDAIMASKPKLGAIGYCIKCLDYSAPDHHAARFPRESLPSSDVGWLATQLTSPFPSLTDKARAIFTWLHHNIAYDTHSFFSGTISKSTPERTITNGLAVCEGYAGLFSALAIKAGLESMVISGASKGFGHKALQPGDPIPEFKSTHAWNAVRIDHGEWKLIDSCWGAGSVCGREYDKKFKPYWFTMDNNEFGYSHYPTDQSQFFRTDGRTSITWEEYVMDDVGGRLQIYGDPASEHGIGSRTFQPAHKHIKVRDPQNPVVRFQFATVCQHWDNERCGKGKPYVMVLNVAGRDGRKSDHIPFQTDGKVWWLDVNRIDLGAPGQKISVYAVTSINSQDARGVSYADYKSRKGKVAMGFGGVAMWELV